jgi:FkbM family methyltransferase
MIIEISKYLIRKAGFRYYKERFLPFGVDLYADLKRFDANFKMDTVFDVGANEGQTYLEVREAFPKAKIFSFEPCSQTFKKLLENTLNDRNAHVFQIALGAENSDAVLVAANDSRLNKVQAAPRMESAGDRIQIKTIDDFCLMQSINTIDLLKTDTEGYDLEVLKGAAVLLASKRIRFIYTETTFDRSNSQCSYFPPIFDYLTSSGYSFIGLYHPYFHSDPLRIHYCNALFSC